MDISLYIKGVKLDLHKDENIMFKAKATELSDIGKMFGDFTLPFTIPASPKNRAIFEFWEESSIDSTFNANKKLDAIIEIGTIPYRTGKVSLNGAIEKNGEVTDYSITFYGELRNLKDLFGDDKLNVLDFPEYTHNFTPSNVMLGLHYQDVWPSTTVDGAQIMYPLISPERVWRLGTNTETDIYTSTGAIDYRELKPALRVIKIIEKIEAYYGITFSRDFLGTAAIQDLFLWCSKDAGYMRALGTSQTATFTSQSNFATLGAVLNNATGVLSFTQNPADLPFGYYIYGIEIIPAPGFETVSYRASLTINGEADKVVKEDLIGRQGVAFQPPKNTATSVAYTISAQVSSTSQFTFTTRLILAKRQNVFGAPFLKATGTGAIKQTNGIVRIQEQLPDIKIQDFITGIMKQFNLVIRALGENEFYLDTLSSYYEGGEIIDISEYTDIEKVDILRPDLNKVINFKYNKTENILGQKYREFFGGVEERGFGDLYYSYEDIDTSTSSDQKIEIPFDNMMFERLSSSAAELDADENLVSNIVVGSAINTELSANNSKPVFFYVNGVVDLDKPFKFRGNGAVVDIDLILNINTENDLDTNQISNSLNFGTEKSTWSYEDVTNNLYNNYWDQYITNIYSLKQRKYNFEAILPVNIISQLSLNDRLNIGDKQYRINEFNINLLNGEGKLNLFENFYDGPFTITNQGIDRATYFTNGGQKHFDIILDTDSSWTSSKTSLVGSGTSWVTLSQTTGFGKTRITVKINYNGNPSADTTLRKLRVDFVTNGQTYSCTITQEGIQYTA